MDTADVDTTLHNRGKTHGNYHEMAKLAQLIKTSVRQASSWNKLTFAQRESVDMVVLKIARIVTGDPNEPDHWLDIEGYAKLGGKDCDLVDG